MSTTWAPDAATMASIERGMADAEAGRTVPLDKAYEEWLQSAEPAVQKSGVANVVVAALGIGFGIAVTVGLLLANTSSSRRKREQVEEAGSTAEAADSGKASLAHDFDKRHEPIRG